LEKSINLYLLLFVLLFSANTFSQKSRGGGVAKSYTNVESQTLLFVFVILEHKQELDVAVKEFYKGKYKIISVDELLKEEQYDDLNSYRFMVCFDGGDFYEESNGITGNYFSSWCMIDRTEHIKYIYNKAITNNLVERFVKEIEETRLKK